MTLPPGTNRFLDLVNDSQPIAAKQITAIVSAIVLAYLDRLTGFTSWDDTGLLTPVVVYVVVNVVGDLWARAQVWSQRSHDAALAAAYAKGQQEGVQPADQHP